MPKCSVPLQRQKRKDVGPRYSLDLPRQQEHVGDTEAVNSSVCLQKRVPKSTEEMLGAENAVLPARSSVGREDILQNHTSI